MKNVQKLQPWSTKGSKYILKDRWITVRADTCLTKEGTVISPYYVLEYPDWVHMVVIDIRRRVLITRQYRHGIKRIIAELPCGTVESRDKNPLAAARRELVEETGYIGKFTLVGVKSPNPATHTNSVYTYLVTNPIKKKNVQRDPFEVLTCQFVDMKQVFKLIDKKEFAQAIHVGSFFLALRKIKETF